MTFRTTLAERLGIEGDPELVREFHDLLAVSESEDFPSGNASTPEDLLNGRAAMVLTDLLRALVAAQGQADDLLGDYARVCGVESDLGED